MQQQQGCSKTTVCLIFVVQLLVCPGMSCHGTSSLYLTDVQCDVGEETLQTLM